MTGRRKTTAPACVLLLGLLFQAPSARAQEAGAPVAYVLEATAAVATGRVRVTMTLPVPAAAPAGLVIPRGYPGGYALILYDRFVEDVNAFSPAGAALAVARAEYGPRWSLGKPGERVARITYAVDVARMEREILKAVATSKIRPRYAGLLGYTVFAYVDGEERRPASLEVLAPQGRPVLTTLSPSVPAAAGRASASAKDYDVLADSQVLTGPDLALSRLEGKIPLVLAVYAEGKADIGREGALARTALDREAPPFVRRMPLAELSRSASFMYSADFRIGMSTFPRGALMAAEMDDRIRAATGGTKSLRDALRALLKAPQPFRVQDLPSIFLTATGVDTREILERWLR